MSKKKNSNMLNQSRLTDHDIYLFKEGRHFKLYDTLGAHPAKIRGQEGVQFGVWAPNAETVSVIGDFNDWNRCAHPLTARPDDSGIWEGFVPGIPKGACYKYHIVSRYNNYRVDKGDPFAIHWETPPKTASVVWDMAYDWQDAEWMRRRGQTNAPDRPMSVYEVHLGSWRRDPACPDAFLRYRHIAPQLVEYVRQMGFTHVEFLPVMEHPFYGSWGYQTVGYFAPSARYGTCQDFMFLIDTLHQHGIGVILDWVPSHFPTDEYGLGFFDGTCLYEHADERKGFHPDWKSSIFNYDRNEVCAFLISSALFWLDKYHIDGLRVDAVASMLYLDYSRKEGEWVPNVNGGRENLEAIAFLRRLNEAVAADYPDCRTIAEESTSWPMVTRPAETGGLGFDMKWNMGWMHDTLDYFKQDPIHRKYHQEKLTFVIWYAFNENFILPLSHDEVVHCKGSLYGRVPGDAWQKCAQLRLLYGYYFTQPGKKLMFMGGEFGQVREWNHDASLDWHLLADEAHRKLHRLFAELNHLYTTQPALYELDFESEGFEWIDFHDSDQSVISYLRKAKDANDALVVVLNFTPVPRYAYKVGAPKGGLWRELLNSDADAYGGSGVGNPEPIEAEPVSFFDRFDFTLTLTLPPLGMLILKQYGTS
ncbi:MAG: 1,4-alpha-glucan branching protein GlgB [Phycisphaerae bacterium]|nr:1,4-alpha-glucan branching protein GlgB [Phycisphaerae bacterium]